MLPEELISLADEICTRKTETQNIEVKAAHEGCPTKLYDTLSSFSNQDSGGIIVFGIDEKQDFIPVGVYDLQNIQQKIADQCQQMQPPVRANFTVAQYQGFDICSAEIPPLDLTERPCFYTGKGKIKGSYVRVGDADLPMTDYEIYTYEAFRSHRHDDERTVDRATLSMLDEDALKEYVSKMRKQKPNFAHFTEDQAYEMLAITRGGKFTLATVLNFGLYPQGYFPQLAITAVVVPGTEIGDIAKDNVRFIDNKRIEGPLSVMLEDAIAFCKRNMKNNTVINPNTGERMDKYEYPIEAIREAVLNALIHRDYSPYTEGTPIQIDLFADRMEIHSPGGLYGRMTVDSLGSARPDLRNPALATMAEHLLNTENRYSGIPTMRRNMAEAGLPDPKFENRINEFVVIFYNSQKSKAAEPKDKKDIIAFCNVPRSRKDIAKYLGIESVSYATSKYVQPLVDSGVLKMTLPETPRSVKQRYVAVESEVEKYE